jgi:hypothetical protein
MIARCYFCRCAIEITDVSVLAASGWTDVEQDWSSPDGENQLGVCPKLGCQITVTMEGHP